MASQSISDAFSQVYPTIDAHRCVCANCEHWSGRFGTMTAATINGRKQWIGCCTSDHDDAPRGADSCLTFLTVGIRLTRPYCSFSSSGILTSIENTERPPSNAISSARFMASSSLIPRAAATSLME